VHYKTEQLNVKVY